MPGEGGSSRPPGSVRPSGRSTEALPSGRIGGPPEPEIPREFHGFRIVRRLGAGGMGVVYEAEQAEPRRRVALKVIGGGRFLDEQQVRWFHREARALARLKHPGIATIFESGQTDEGQHFFAMELVEGVTLLEHLAARSRKSGLSPAEVRERVLLVRKVSEAVNYAHQRGVIHRDLKPSNILVVQGSLSKTGAGAAVPDVKVLDFGLARITDPDPSTSSIVTHVGQVVGTPAYMSPEQARGNPDDVDLRADVYSLGVILYEVLTGRLPYDVPRTGLADVIRVICETPPRPPRRGWTGTARLDPDLETIVLKTLEKDPASRYQSAAALVDDLDRYLTGFPILARPASALDQIRKLVMRHKLPAALLGGIAGLLIVLAVTMTVQASRIAREAERANREASTATSVSDFLVGLFSLPDPGEARGRTITVKEVLDRGAESIEHDLATQPVTEARLMRTMGRVYQNLALFDQADAMFRKSLNINQRTLGNDHVEVARSLNSLGWLRHYQGRDGEAKALHERALDLLEPARRADDLDLAWTRYYLATSAGDRKRSIELLHQALAVFEVAPGDNDIAVSWCLNDLGTYSFGSRDFSEALAYFQRALALKEKRLDPLHVDIGTSTFNVGNALMELERYDEALPYFERVRAIQEKVLDPKHPHNADGLYILGEFYRRRGEPATARPLLERALALWEEVGSADPADVSRAITSLATLARDEGRRTDAEALYGRALQVEDRSLPAEHPARAVTLRGYATLQRAQGRLASAEELEQRAEAIEDASAARP